ncbi:MAG TPA: Fic family protein [Phycisphaerae bacterium]|nr:Fic family protein [Phycisphaerae bacterium]
MSRYDVATGIEGESEPGSRGRVLRNLLGITSKRAMDQAEADALLKAQKRYVSLVTPGTQFTAAVLCTMHRDWLGHIYPWAGHYRTVEMSKGNFVWPPAFLVEQNMARFEREFLVSFTPCSHGAIEDVAMRLAKVQAEFLLVHPFREGNGRMSRWVTNLMALQAGFPEPDYGFTKRGKSRQDRAYLAAVIAGYGQNYEPLGRFLAEALRRGLRAEGTSLMFRAPSK